MTPSDSADGLGEVGRTIVAEAAAIHSDLVALRREFHSFPEASREEYRTTERLYDILRGLGLSPRGLDVRTGLTCDVLPTEELPADDLLGLRADIDALPLMDTKNVEYRSLNDGVCHACGHDVHTTILLGTAMVLVRLRERGMLHRGVRLIFQPCEEEQPGGAADVIRAGRLEGVREVYALHCDPRTTVGQVALRTGAITSAADMIDITFDGPGGHTSRPHLSSDLIGAMSSVVNQVPLLLSRRVDPRAGASLVWGRIHAGTTPNAIPSSGRLAGTLRVLDLEGWRTARELIPRLVDEVVEPFGIRARLKLGSGLPPAVNHASGTARLTQVVTELIGPHAVATTEQSLGGEDFSELLLEVPGALGRLGVRPPSASHWPDLHQPAFDVDERSLNVGVRVMAGLAV